MKKRTVAYVRVSTASKAQLHSYEFQERYWQDKFTDDPENELIGIYADRGISGRSVYKRPQFLVMMQDARDGKFDVIHTKSVSRFARNTVQLLEAIRELRDLGIEVVFEKGADKHAAANQRNILDHRRNGRRERPKGRFRTAALVNSAQVRKRLDIHRKTACTAFA